MLVAPPHPREAERLSAVAELDVLIRDGDARLDDLTALASELCGAPISVVSLVDFDKQYFVSRVGLEPASTSRNVAFCAHAIQGSSLFEVPDATQDDRFADNPLVTGAPDIRHYAGVPLRGSDGLPLGTLCVINTVPNTLSEVQRSQLERLARQAVHLIELHRATQKLQRANAARTQAESARRELVMRLAHDIRTPLTGVVGLAQSLGTHALPEGARSDLAILQSATEHLHALLDELLSAGQSGEASCVVSEPTELRAVIERATAFFSASAHQDDLQVRVLVDDELPDYVLTDQRRLTQVLANLVGNAIKFTEAGEVCVRARAEAHTLAITVSDSGPGIEPEALPNLFAAYTQSQCGQGQGTGLGLAIVAELTEQLGGTVSVQSRVGHGSDFTVRLPLRPCDSPQQAPASAAHTLRILVIDDVLVNRLVATRMLEVGGASCDTAEDGHQGISLAEVVHYDAILIDHELPGLSGPDVLRRLRAVPGSSPRLFGWTGHNDASIHARFEAAGAEGVLPKPLRKADVDALLEQLRRQPAA